MSYHKKNLTVVSSDQTNDQPNSSQNLATKVKEEPFESPLKRANQDSYFSKNLKEITYIALCDEIKKETADNTDVECLCGYALPMIDGMSKTTSNEEDVEWLGGKALPMIYMQNSINTGNEINKMRHFKTDSTSFKPQVFTLSDLFDDNFDFWDTSSIKSGTESKKKEHGTSPADLINEKNEMIDFDLSKFAETQMETINIHDAGTDEHTQFQGAIEKDYTLPSISSTFSLLHPWLNTFASNYQNQTESVSKQSFFEREETIGNSFTTCRSNKHENLEDHDIFKICSRQTGAFSESYENQGANLNHMEKLISKNNKHGDELKEILFQIGTDESWKMRDFIEWQDNEEAEFLKGKDLLTQKSIRDKIIKENVKDYYPKLVAYKTLQPRLSKSSTVGNSQFFVRDSVPPEASVETYNEQVIFSCFDETSENLEITTPFICKNVEKRKKINSNLGYRNKKYEDSISALIKQDHQKLDQAKSRSFPSDEVVVGPSANGSMSNETPKTTFLQDSNGDKVKLVNVKNTPSYLTLSNNFGNHAVQGNNDANHLLFVMDNATTPNSNTCLATGEINFYPNIPSAIFVNQTDVDNVQPDNKIDPRIDIPAEQRMLIQHAEQNKNQESSFSISALPKITLVGDLSVEHKAVDSFETLFSSIKPEFQHQQVKNLNSTITNSQLESTCYNFTPQKADKSNIFLNSHPVVKFSKDKHAIRETGIPVKMESESPPIVLSQCKSETNDSGIDTSLSKKTIFSGTQSSQQECLKDVKPPNVSTALLSQLYLPLSFFTQNQNVIKTPVTVTTINSDPDPVLSNGSKTRSIHQACVNVPVNVPASNNITHLTSSLPNSLQVETETSNDSKPSAGFSSRYLVPLCLAACTSFSKPVYVTAKTPSPLAPTTPSGRPHRMQWPPPTRSLAKPKKGGLKTVRELLREKKQNWLTISGKGSNVSNASNASIVKRPVLNRACKSSGFPKWSVVRTATPHKDPSICFLSRDISGNSRDSAGGVSAAGLVDIKPAPRPNILILPSASRTAEASAAQPCKRLGNELEDAESLSGSTINH